MVQSSAKSLIQAMENIDEFLAGEGSLQMLGLVFHNLKGVLLNMGEKEWADYFRIIERRLAEEECDIGQVQDTMREGLTDILSYSRN